MLHFVFDSLFILSFILLPIIFVSSCFLRTDTHFIWAFIGPVILIFLANIGFFIMTFYVIWHHPKKSKPLKKFRSWMKAAVSLTVIMGLTWVPGLFVLMHNEVVPLAFISVFLVAFQGTFIFLIFVVLFKPARTAYTMWLKSTVRKSETLSSFLGNSTYFEKVRLYIFANGRDC